MMSSTGDVGSGGGGGDDGPPKPSSAPFLSSAYDDDDEDDIEALASKACALASVPVPDYADEIERSNARWRKKYKDRQLLDDDEDDDEDDEDDEDEDARAQKEEFASSGIALADRTSQILSNFQDYVSGIGNDDDMPFGGDPSIVGSPGSPSKGMREILEGGGGASRPRHGGRPDEETVEFGSDDAMSGMAGRVRSDNKTRLLESSSPGGANGAKVSSFASRKPHAGLHREWSHGNDLNSAGGIGSPRNLHDAASAASWEENGDFESGMLARGQRYTHPFLQSRRVKIGVLNCLLVAAVAFGVSVGVTSRSKREAEELGDKVSELEEDLKKNNEAADGKVVPPTQQTEKKEPEKAAVAAIGMDEAHAYQKSVMKYRPRMYDADDGWGGGSTYLDAYRFCTEGVAPDGEVIPAAIRVEGRVGIYDVCPYDAICPLGVGTQPLGGYADPYAEGAGGGSTWVPISDAPNDWVQTAFEQTTHATCVRYSSLEEYAPDWGIEVGDKNSPILTVMCCLSDDYLNGIDESENHIGDAVGKFTGWMTDHDIDKDSPDFATYQDTAAKYLPLEFDRSRGWNGRTYIEALEFCGILPGYEICPYEAICPLGPDSVPLGGRKGEAKGSWAPILDSANDWVQIGEDNSCIKYSNENSKPPSWSITGSGSEDITRHILCCVYVGHDDDALAIVADVLDETVSKDPAKDEVDPTIQAYEAAAKTWVPVTYNRSEGWTGKTYHEAVRFCTEVIPGYNVCPYEAVCPLGPGSEPMGGYKEVGAGGESATMRVPVLDEMNYWIAVSQGPQSCMYPPLTDGRRPDWGVTGVGSEAFTASVMCCAIKTDDNDAEELALVDRYDEEMAYKLVAEKYLPSFYTRENGWKGQTYGEAVQFCGEEGPGRSLCPYEALCPLGADGQPLGGTRYDITGGVSEDSGDTGQWSPILGEQGNEWVQLSKSNICVLYTSEHPTTPEWGVSGEGNEEITRNIVCCESLVDSSGPPLVSPEMIQEQIAENNAEETKQAYEQAVAEFTPIGFERDDGWKGKTYLDAVTFCASSDLIICPYQALCPMGPNTTPIGGYVAGQYVPISDDANDWVDISVEGACYRWTDTYPERPEWGMSDEGNEEVTGKVMCCKGSIWGSAEEGFLYEVAAQKYHPDWYNRGDGWKGQTFQEARAFCASKKKFLCPYEAYCPMADLDVPLGGNKPDNSWAPADDKTDLWISISSENTCKVYDLVKGEPPDFTGAGGEESTRNIMCCGQDEEVVPATVAVATPEPSPLPTQKPTPTPKPTFSPEEVQAIAEAAKEEAEAEQAEAFEEIYAKTATQYLPITYGRSDGWNGQTYLEAVEFCGRKDGYEICPIAAICPLGPNGEPMGGYDTNGIPGQSWVPMSDDANDWVNLSEEGACTLYSEVYNDRPDWGITGEGSEIITRKIMCCKGSIWGTGEESFLYELASQKYQPKWYDRSDGWKGQTYQEAVEFCPSKGQVLCPYEAYCPMADLDVPLGGAKSDNPGGAWVAVSDEQDLWISASSDNTCSIYDLTNDKPPDFTGTEGEPLTRHIMCCDTPGKGWQEGKVEAATTAPTTMPTNVYQYIGKTFLPIEFLREDGWKGQTYLEAVHFCGRRDGYEICPFEALCPTGELGLPFGGYDVDGISGQSWVPISDDANEWVNMSEEGACTRYSKVNSKPPDWGMTGVGNEEMTRRLWCCKGSVTGGGEETFLYEIATQKYNPVWYNRAQGWKGQTYEEAFEFCPTKGKVLCPYEAYCPMAELDSPFGGYKPDNSWGAVAGTNGLWISLSSNNTCAIYDYVTGKTADFAGAEGEPLTRNILCCDAPVAATAAATSKPSSEPTRTPTTPPTSLPTPLPTSPPIPAPTPPPTSLPTALPTSNPTMPPSALPTSLPTLKATSPPIGGATGSSSSASMTAAKYKPVWYDRSSGWSGATFDDAFEFCSSKGPDHDICPYEVLCPDGALSMPYGGEAKSGSSESWAPINTPFNSWVLVSEPQVCARYETLHPNEGRPSWGLTGINGGDTSHILCCDMGDPQDGATEEETFALAYGGVFSKYDPKWFDRSDGWNGKTYVDAITFCASQNSYIPCPYDAYCPMGEGNQPFGGFDGTEEAWAPVMDGPNSWVQIGSYEKNSVEHACMKHSSLNNFPPSWGLIEDDSTEKSPHIMCCKEPDNHFLAGMEANVQTAVAKTKHEQDVLGDMNPVWFGRKHGYKGTTHEDASAFCKNVADMVLCPKSAYCMPEDSQKPLFLQRDAFQGEQWAPLASEFGTSAEYWVSIGQSPSTCKTHEELQLSKPSWIDDGSREELKEHILCCQNPKHLAKEENLKQDLNPIWMDSSHGWNGSSHDDAIEFCESFGNRKLCPYIGYCPHGPGQEVMGGHRVDFTTVGEQWAPVFGEANHWVMIGQKYQNRATTCLDSNQLEGESPSWGLSTDRADMKKYILCCNF